MQITSEIILTKSDKDITELRNVNAFALLSWINIDIELLNKTNQPGRVISNRFGKQRKWFQRNMATLVQEGFATYEKIIFDESIIHRYKVAKMSHGNLKMSHGNLKMSHGEDKNVPWETKINNSFPLVVEDADTPHGTNLTPSIILKDKKSKKKDNAGAREEIEVETGYISAYQKDHKKFHDPLTAHANETYAIREFLQTNYINRLPTNPKQWADANGDGVRVWVSLTQTDFDWLQAPLINRRLGKDTNRKLLQQAWEEWAGAGHRTSSIGKILDWYDLLVKDPTATPWKYQGANTNGKGHSTTSGRAKEGWHGLATSTDKPGTGEKPSIEHLELPPLIID